jgi:hypothetical protein
LIKKSDRIGRGSATFENQRQQAEHEFITVNAALDLDKNDAEAANPEAEPAS